MNKVYIMIDTISGERTIVEARDYQTNALNDYIRIGNVEKKEYVAGIHSDIYFYITLIH